MNFTFKEDTEYSLEKIAEILQKSTDRYIITHEEDGYVDHPYNCGKIFISKNLDILNKYLDDMLVDLPHLVDDRGETTAETIIPIHENRFKISHRVRGDNYDTERGKYINVYNIKREDIIKIQEKMKGTKMIFDI